MNTKWRELHKAKVAYNLSIVLGFVLTLFLGRGLIILAKTGVLYEWPFGVGVFVSNG